MLIIGDSIGNIESLSLNFKNKKKKVLIENLFSINGFPINQLKCTKTGLIFFGSTNGTLGLYDSKKEQVIRNKEIGDTELITYHTFKDEKIVAFYSNYMRIWKKKKNLYYFSKNKLICGKKFTHVLVNKSESFLLTTTFFGNQIFLWSILKDRLILGGKNELKEFIVSLKGNLNDLFTIGTHTGSIYVYSIYGHLIRTIKRDKLYKEAGKNDLQKSAAWFGENLLFSGKSSGRIELIDLRCDKKISYLTGHSCEVSNIDVSIDKNLSNPFLVASSDISGNLKIWDMRNRKELFFQKRFNSKVTSIGFL